MPEIGWWETCNNMPEIGWLETCNNVPEIGWWETCNNIGWWERLEGKISRPILKVVSHQLDSLPERTTQFTCRIG